MSDNEIYLLIKYIISVLWRVAKRLSYIEDARCLKVNLFLTHTHTHTYIYIYIFIYIYIYIYIYTVLF